MDDAQKYNGEIDVSKRTQRTFTSNSFSKPEIVESPSGRKCTEDDKTRAQDSSLVQSSSAVQAADIDHLGPKAEHCPDHDSVTAISSTVEKRAVPEPETLKVQVSKVSC